MNKNNFDKLRDMHLRSISTLERLRDIVPSMRSVDVFWESPFASVGIEEVHAYFENFSDAEEYAAKMNSVREKVGLPYWVCIDTAIHFDGGLTGGKK